MSACDECNGAGWHYDQRDMHAKGKPPLECGIVACEECAHGKRIAILIAERDRLKAIVDTLPKTADGVHVAPGSTVWCFDAELYGDSHGDFEGNPFEAKITSWDVGPDRETLFYIDGRGEVWAFATFSTREAAEKARNP